MGAGGSCHQAKERLVLPGGAGGGSGAPLGRVTRGTRVPPRGRLLAPPTHPVRWPGQGTHSAGGKSDVFPEGLGQGHQECGPAESRARLSCHGPGRPWQSCHRLPRSLGPKDPSGAGHAAAACPALRDSCPPGAPSLKPRSLVPPTFLLLPVFRASRTCSGPTKPLSLSPALPTPGPGWRTSTPTVAPPTRRSPAAPPTITRRVWAPMPA